MTINIPVVVSGIGVIDPGTRVAVSGTGFVVLGAEVVVPDPTFSSFASPQTKRRPFDIWFQSQNKTIQYFSTSHPFSL